MFVILNALKYLYFKEFFSTFLLLYFFSTHVKEHVDNLIVSSDYFTRLLNENVWMNIQNFQPYTTLVGLLHVTWLRHNCWLEIPVLGRNHTRAAFWIMMNACKGRSMSLSYISELDQRPDVCFWHLNAGVKFGLNPNTPSLSPACSPNNFWTAYLERSLNPRFQQKVIFRLPMVFGTLCSP